MTRTIGFLKSNAIALAALFIALGGTSYAAVAIPRNSVGSRQLRKAAVTSSKIRSGAITPGKLAGGSFGGRILYLVEIENNGAIAESSPRGVKTQNWNSNTGGGVVFPRPIPKGCEALASGAGPGIPTATNVPPAVGAGIEFPRTLVEVGVNGPIGVTLAIVCAR